jgi:hypothetical protein
MVGRQKLSLLDSVPWLFFSSFTIRTKGRVSNWIYMLYKMSEDFLPTFHGVEYNRGWINTLIMYGFFLHSCSFSQRDQKQHVKFAFFAGYSDISVRYSDISPAIVIMFQSKNGLVRDVIMIDVTIMITSPVLVIHCSKYDVYCMLFVMPLFPGCFHILLCPRPYQLFC